MPKKRPIILIVDNDAATVSSISDYISSYADCLGATNYEDAMVAALVTLLNEAAKKIRQKLCLAQMDEISIVGNDRTRLVCRYFSVDGHDFLLTVLAPPDQAYRRVTNQTIKEIKRIWPS